MKGEPADRDIESRARSVFDASVDMLDAGTLSRLNQARQRALADAAGAPRRSIGRGWLVPAGAVAAGVLAAALLLRMPVDEGGRAAPMASSPVATQESLEMLGADEAFDIAASGEDLEFYAWVASQTTGVGQSG
jgi:hypothetical protein